MAKKEKVQKPQVWDGMEWVDASKGTCHKCAKKDYIAIRSKYGPLCFQCFEAEEKKWNSR